MLRKALAEFLGGLLLAALVIGSGCIAGAALANIMSDRATVPHGVAEVVATLGLVLVIFAFVRTGRTDRAPAAVAAYWFTSSAGAALAVLLIRARYPAPHRPRSPEAVLPPPANEIRIG